METYVTQQAEHDASNGKVMGSIPRGCIALTDEMYTWNASQVSLDKCINIKD